MILVTVDGVDLPIPTTYGVGTSDLDTPNTKLTAGYTLKRERGREGRRKVLLTYDDLSIQDLKIISDAIRPASLTVTYFDCWAFKMETKKMYASADREATAKIIKDASESKWQTAFNLTEF